jgi:hypothetical protein
MRAVQTAVARMVLDGGERYTDFAVSEHGLGNGDWGYLTLSEVALLANMDERSVRNAANPKLPDPLKTEAMGKRSLVKPEEARRWLAGRKGFIPTSKGATDDAHRPPHFNYVLTEEEFKDIQREMDNGSSLQAAFLKILSKSER